MEILIEYGLVDDSEILILARTCKSYYQFQKYYLQHLPPIMDIGKDLLDIVLKSKIITFHQNLRILKEWIRTQELSEYDFYNYIQIKLIIICLVHC